MSTQIAHPIHYSEQLADLICDLMKDGLSLNRICQRSDMPAYGSVMRWLDATPAFREKYTRARELLLDRLADEVIEIADNATNETFQSDRLRFDARRWYLSKLAPKRYGERLELAGDKASPLTITVKREDIP